MNKQRPEEFLLSECHLRKEEIINLTLRLHNSGVNIHLQEPPKLLGCAAEELTLTVLKNRFHKKVCRAVLTSPNGSEDNVGIDVRGIAVFDSNPYSFTAQVKTSLLDKNNHLLKKAEKYGIQTQDTSGYLLAEGHVTLVVPMGDGRKLASRSIELQFGNFLTNREELFKLQRKEWDGLPVIHPEWNKWLDQKEVLDEEKYHYRPPEKPSIENLLENYGPDLTKRYPFLKRE